MDSRGLTTGAVPDDGQAVEVRFDLIDHAVIARSSGGGSASFPLGPMSVAAFHGRFKKALRSIGANDTFSGKPSEIPHGVPFDEDEAPRPYDSEAVSRFHQALVRVESVFSRFRTAFIGKVSPVHLFWGSFDLAVTRFSGRAAPLHPGGIPALPDAVTREAYSHEVSSAGFWPGGGGVDYPAFYSYAYPTPAGFADESVKPKEAFFQSELGEFLLPYDAVRNAADPEGALMAFLTSTYEAAAKLGNWDRKALECAPGEPLRPRPLG